MSSQIKQCQDRGKIVTLSVGGAISNIGFRTDSQATAFADIIWDKFLGGASLYRPFGDAILDGYAELFDFFPFRALMLILPCSHFRSSSSSSFIFKGRSRYRGGVLDRIQCIRESAS